MSPSIALNIQVQAYGSFTTIPTTYACGKQCLSHFKTFRIQTFQPHFQSHMSPCFMRRENCSSDWLHTIMIIIFIYYCHCKHIVRSVAVPIGRWDIFSQQRNVWDHTNILPPLSSRSLLTQFPPIGGHEESLHSPSPLHLAYQAGQVF